MFGTGFGIFIQLPGNPSRRILHPAKITAVTGGMYTAEFEESDVAPQPGQDVLVYFEQRQKFMQQSARLDAVLQTAPKPVIGFQLAGQPVSAESRQCYRVSTVVAGLTARLNEEDGCALQEVSATGFAVIARSKHQVGTVVTAGLRYQDKQFTGKATVQSVKELAGGRTRYGLHCIDDKKLSGGLLAGVRQISTAVQQDQLRRRAGGA